MCTQFSHGMTWGRNQDVRLQDDEKKKLLLQIKILLQPHRVWNYIKHNELTF